MQLKRQLFLNAQNHLKDQDLKTYLFFEYIGKLLPERFDEEDLASTVYSFQNDLSNHPERLPDWMRENYLFTVKQIAKIHQLLNVHSSPSMERFVMAYERLLKRHRRIED